MIEKMRRFCGFSSEPQIRCFWGLILPATQPRVLAAFGDNMFVFSA